MKTATIERYPVRGTPRHCLALFYRGAELTPHESPTCPRPQWIPDDAEGLARLQRVARAHGFTHCRITGDWDRRTKPQGGALAR